MSKLTTPGRDASRARTAGVAAGARRSGAAAACIALVSAGAPLAIARAAVREPRSAVIPRVLTCSGPTRVVRPTSYVLACADANQLLQGLTWTTWSHTQALGRGTFVQNNCTPNCAAGRFVRYAATVRLAAVRATANGPLFSKLVYTYSPRAGAKATPHLFALPLAPFG